MPDPELTWEELLHAIQGPMIISPHDQILASNDPARAEEIEKIQQTIGALRAEVSARESTMQKLGRIMITIEEHKRHLESVAQRHQALVSAFRRLPPEILLDIFQLCSQVSAPENECTLVQQSTPWPLSQVCSRWRRLLVSTPTMWNHITIAADDYGRPGSSQLLQLQLSRAEALPLHIHLEPPTWRTLDFAILDVILPESERWHVLSVSTGLDLHQYLTKRAGHYNSLHTIQFLGDFYPASPNPFGYLPKLRCVSCPGSIAQNAFPWDQLSTLDLRFVTFDDTELEMLRRATSLVRLSVMFDSSSASWGLSVATDDPSEVLPLPHLHSLSIASACGFSETGSFIKTIVAPELQHLRMNNYRLPLTSSSPPVGAWKLKTLQIFCVVGKIDSLVSLLGCLPNLEGLDLGFNIRLPATGLLQALTVPDSDEVSPLCPRLSGIILRASKADSQTLIELVDSRTSKRNSATVAHLRCVQLFCHRFVAHPQDAFGSGIRTHVERIASLYDRLGFHFSIWGDVTDPILGTCGFGLCTSEHHGMTRQIF